MATIPMYRTGTYIERLLARFEVQPDGCWQWTGTYRGDTGYGQIARPDNTSVGAHVAMWEHLRGPIPADMEMDHLCRNTGCVNPDHLEPVTRVENQRRARPYRKPLPPRPVKVADVAPPRTHCRAGLHERTEENRYPNGGDWTCRPCKMTSRQAFIQRRAASVVLPRRGAWFF